MAARIDSADGFRTLLARRESARSEAQPSGLLGAETHSSVCSAHPRIGPPPRTLSRKFRELPTMRCQADCKSALIRRTVPTPTPWRAASLRIATPPFFRSARIGFPLRRFAPENHLARPIERDPQGGPFRLR